MPEFDLAKIAERHRKIGTLLFQEWDPIGVGTNPNLADEYSGYIRGVYEVAMKTRSGLAVAERLSHIEKEFMGLPGRAPGQLLPVANKVIDLVADLYDPNMA